MAENGDVEESNDKPGSDDLFNLVDNLLASARAGKSTAAKDGLPQAIYIFVIF